MRISDWSSDVCSSDLPAAFRRRVRALELAVLRGARPAPGLEGLRKAVEASRAVGLLPWFDRLAGILAPLAEALDGGAARLSQLVDAHLAAAEALAAPDSESGADRPWAGAAGEAAGTFAGDESGRGAGRERGGQ